MVNYLNFNETTTKDAVQELCSSAGMKVYANQLSQVMQQLQLTVAHADTCNLTHYGSTVSLAFSRYKRPLLNITQGRWPVATVVNDKCSTFSNKQGGALDCFPSTRLMMDHLVEELGRLTGN